MAVVTGISSLICIQAGTPPEPGRAELGSVPAALPAADREEDLNWQNTDTHTICVQMEEAAAEQQPKKLTQLAASRASWVRMGVASNLHTAAATLELLSRDTDTGVRECVARNVRAPSAVLVRLSYDQGIRVRRAVAGNVRCPVRTWHRLVNHDPPFIAELLDDECPQEIVIRLAHDNYSLVRWLVARHPNCPPYIRAMLQLADL